MKTVTFPKLLLFSWCISLLIASALIKDGKFISVDGDIWKLTRCSVTIFHHVLVLLLSYNCD